MNFILKWFLFGTNNVNLFLLHSDRYYIAKRSTCIVVEKTKIEWFSNIRADILSGIVVALALIPEALAFSIIAGVDPMVGLYASFIIAVDIVLIGVHAVLVSDFM